MDLNKWRNKLLNSVLDITDSLVEEDNENECKIYMNLNSLDLHYVQIYPKKLIEEIQMELQNVDWFLDDVSYCTISDNDARFQLRFKNENASFAVRINKVADENIFVVILDKSCSKLASQQFYMRIIDAIETWFKKEMKWRLEFLTGELVFEESYIIKQLRKNL
jgi:hypothetical protein